MPPARAQRAPPAGSTAMQAPTGPMVQPGAGQYDPETPATETYTVDDMRAHGVEMARTAIFETTLWYFVQEAEKEGKPTVMINGLYAIMEYFGFVQRKPSETPTDAQ